MQAKEITATVGQAFELAYKKFLETKQAQEDFKRLVQMLKTASPEEKVEIERKLTEVNKIRAEEAERQKKMAAIQARMPEPQGKPVTKIDVKGTKGKTIANETLRLPMPPDPIKDISNLLEINTVKTDVIMS